MSPNSTRPAPFAPMGVLLAGVFAASSAAGQSPIVMPGPPDGSDPVAQAADSLYRAGLYEESLSRLEEYLAASATSYVAEVLAGREALVLGYVASHTDKEEARAWLRRSIAHGRRAMALEPLEKDGRYVTMAALGRLALIAGGRERARLAVVADSAARSLLADDSLHAGARDVLGRLYLEVARLSWFERIFARRWLGGDLMSRATWSAAETHLRRAIEIQPERNLYYVDLGILLINRDRLDEARDVLEAGVLVPLGTPAEEFFRDHARRLLEQVRGRSGALPPAVDIPAQVRVLVFGEEEARLEQIPDGHDAQ